MTIKNIFINTLLTWPLEVYLVLDCSFVQFFVQQALIFGMNKSYFRQHSLKLLNYWIPHNSLELKIQSLTFFLQKISNLIRQPDELYKSNQDRVFYRIIEHSQDRRYNLLLFRFIPNLEYLYQDHSTVNRKEDLN